jgi:hypothetical protein
VDRVMLNGPDRTLGGWLGGCPTGDDQRRTQQERTHEIRLGILVLRSAQ